MLPRFALVFAVVGAVGLSFGQSARRPFSITISTPQQVIKAGSDVRLDITMTNTSDQDIRVVQGRPEVTYQINVLQSGGNSAVETPYGRRAHGKANPPIALSFVSGILKPGEKLQEHTILNDIHDLSQPGKYIIQVGRIDPSSKAMRGPESKDVVKSNTITITVTP